MKSAPELVVVLAAGLGSRLRCEGGPPKPLLPVAGRPLISRVLDLFAAAGVNKAVVVIGFRGDEVAAGIESAGPLLDVEFVENPRWEMSNGLSVLAARSAVRDRPFFLSMSDHILEPSLIHGLGSAQIPDKGLVLAVDRKIDEVYDIDDATKVLTKEGRIDEIGKELDKYDAIDTGLFTCSPYLFDAIEEVSRTRDDRDCSLSDGVKAIAASGLALVYDVGEGLWQDVDTAGAAAHAEKLFGGGC